MVLTSSLFDFIRESYGGIGVFTAIVGWEHIMLLIKYMMQSFISPFPSFVLNEMKKEEHKRIEERNSNLRDKTKERRSSHGSIFTRSRFRRNMVSSRTFSDSDMSRKDKYDRRSTPLPKTFHTRRKSSFPPSPTSTPSSEDDEISPLLERHCDNNDSPQITETSEMDRSNNQSILRKRNIGRAAVDVRSLLRSPSKSQKKKTQSTRTSKATVTTPTLSPFHQYFQNQDINSPLADNDFNSNNQNNDDESLSLAGMLSTGEWSNDSNGENSAYRTPMKASMSRSRMERLCETEQYAAEERIEKRISSISERRRHKPDR